MRLNSKKTSRLVTELVTYLVSKGVLCNVWEGYSRGRNGRPTFQLFHQDSPILHAEGAVDVLIETCQDLQLDLTKSGIKDSRGYQVFLPDNP